MAMGDLLLFRPSRNAARSTRAIAQSQDARILFFTGVRYGREREPNPASTDQDAPPKGGVDGTGGGRRKRRG
jgi:hypothetical protein